MTMENYLNERLSNDERILDLISCYGFIDGAHHKQWLLDQIARITMGCRVEKRQYTTKTGDKETYLDLGTNDTYEEWAKGEEDCFDWDPGIAP